MTTLTRRSHIITLVSDAIAAGAHQDRACGAILLSERTLQRWQRDQCRGDQRPIRVQTPKNRLSSSERQAVLAVANSDEFAHLAPSQIVPRLADQGRYIASESSFYRVLKAASQLQHRGPERPRQKRSKPRALRASAPHQLFSWDITLFKTLEYRPDYPNRPFENLFAARQWVGKFVHWYNHEHRHSAIRFVTPNERHAGQDAVLLEKRVDVYEAAKAKHPQRWSGSTRNWQPVQVVHLNPEQQKSSTPRRKENQTALKKVA